MDVEYGSGVSAEDAAGQYRDAVKRLAGRMIVCRTRRGAGSAGVRKWRTASSKAADGTWWHSAAMTSPDPAVSPAMSP